MSTPPLVVGVAAANAPLDMALRPTGARWAVAHDDAGLATLVARLQAVQPTLMVLAATGGDQRAVVAALAATGLPVVVGIARQSRDGAKATGQLAQTDALDARALAHVAEAVRLTPWHLQHFFVETAPQAYIYSPRLAHPEQAADFAK
jgi:transposase